MSFRIISILLTMGARYNGAKAAAEIDLDQRYVYLDRTVTIGGNVQGISSETSLVLVVA